MSGKTYTTPDGPFDVTLLDALEAAMPESPVRPLSRAQARAKLNEAARSALGVGWIGDGDRRIDRALQLLRKQGRARFHRMSGVWARVAR